MIGWPRDSQRTPIDSFHAASIRDTWEGARSLRGGRGILLAGDIAKRALRASGRAACDVEELSADTLTNRIVRTSLWRLLARQINHQCDVRAEMRVAYRRLDGVLQERMRKSTFVRLQLGRNRRPYQFLLTVCRLVSENLMVDEGTGHSTFQDIRRDKATIRKSIEDFATGFNEREQNGFEVNPARRRRIDWVEVDAVTYADPRMIPAMEADVILKSRDRRILLDAKYYTSALSRRVGVDVGKLNSNNRYQPLAYLRNRDAKQMHRQEHERILLYPQVDRQLREKTSSGGFRNQARAVEFRRQRDIHNEMREVIAA